MDQLIIRQARENDLETLLKFEQAIVEAERPFDQTLKKGKISYYDLAKMMKDPESEIAVAEINNQLIGSGFARIEKAKPYLQHPLQGYLGFMYVVPEFRGKGINQLIIKYLENWLRSKNIHEVRLNVYVENEAAIRAYEKINFQKHMLEMRKSLDS